MNGFPATFPAEFEAFDSNNLGRPVPPESEFNPVIITAASTKTIDGYLVPVLTVDEVVKAYNTLISGNSCLISDPNNTVYFAVNQADVIGEDINIEISYFGNRCVTYLIENNAVIMAMSGVAVNVPYAEGSAPTAEEFDALIDALIEAGLMEQASA